MEIKEYTFQRRNDFNAILECEHCGEVQELRNGYNDEYYHTRILPAIKCKVCKKSSNA